MGAIRQYLPHYTSKDYERWEGRWELIKGVAISMSPMPSPRHQRISAALTEMLLSAIRASGCKKCTVYQPIDYFIDEDTIINPDLLIVCKPIKGQYLTFPPELVVEILSPSTAVKDRNTKYDLYQNEEIPYYIIIDPDTDSAEIYHLTDGVYKQVKTDIFDINGCMVQIEIEKVFAI